MFFKILSLVAIFFALFLVSCSGGNDFYSDVPSYSEDYYQPSYSPAPYYATPQRYQGYRPAPASRYYANPYEIPPTQYYPQPYDADQYYVPPTRYRGVERQQPTMPYSSPHI